MSSIVYLRNKKTGVVYAYLNESQWDPVKKKSVSKRKCIGHVDPDTGDIVENRQHKQKEEANVQSEIISLFFNKIVEDVGLKKILKVAFPEQWKLILTLAYYLASSNNDLVFCKQWSERNATPINKPVSIPMISALLGNITPNNIAMFFNIWMDMVDAKDAYLDSVSFEDAYDDLSEYAETLGITIEPEYYESKVNIYYSTKDNTPLCYSLSNVSNDRRLNTYGIDNRSFRRLTIIRDEESGDTVTGDDLSASEDSMTARVLPSNEIVSKVVDKVRNEIASPENYVIMFGRPMYLMSFMTYYNKHKLFAHVGYDTNRAAKDLPTFINIINGCMNEIESGHEVEDHKPLYDKYLLISEVRGKKSIEHNSQSIMHRDVNNGFFAIISDSARSAEIAIGPFLQRALTAEMFDTIMNEYDNTALNLFSDVFLRSRIFIQFIALILRMEAEKTMNRTKLNKTLSYKQMINELKSIYTITIPTMKKPLHTDLNDTQKMILKAFELELTPKK